MVNSEYFINNPIYLKIKRKFIWRKLKKEENIIKAFVNERAVEIPFVFGALPKDKNATTIVDLGCVESPVAVYCASIGYKVIGVDYRTYPYQHPNLTFVQADLTQLPLDDNSCDVALAVSTVEHVGIGFYKDPQKQSGDSAAILQIRRVVKAQGMIILTVPFGKKDETNQQRVYDCSDLDRLLKDLKIEEQRFFVNRIVDEKFTNYWEEVSKEQAGLIDNNGTTKAVALIKAINIK